VRKRTSGGTADARVTMDADFSTGAQALAAAAPQAGFAACRASGAAAAAAAWPPAANLEAPPEIDGDVDFGARVPASGLDADVAFGATHAAGANASALLARPAQALNWPACQSVAPASAMDACFDALDVMAPAREVDFSLGGAARGAGGNADALMTRAPAASSAALNTAGALAMATGAADGLASDVDCAAPPRARATSSYNAALAARPVAATNWPAAAPAGSLPSAAQATHDVAFGLGAADEASASAVEGAYCADAALARRGPAASNWPGEALDHDIDSLFCSRDVCFGFCAAETDRWRCAFHGRAHAEVPYCAKVSHHDWRLASSVLVGMLAHAPVTTPDGDAAAYEAQASMTRVESLTSLAAAC